MSVLVAVRVGGLTKVAMVEDPSSFADALSESTHAPAAIEGCWGVPATHSPTQFLTLAHAALTPMRVGDEGWFDIAPAMLAGTMKTVSEGGFPGAFRLVTFHSDRSAVGLRRGLLPGRYDPDVADAWSLPESTEPCGAVKHARDLVRAGADGAGAASTVANDARATDRQRSRWWVVGAVVGLRGWVGATRDTAATIEQIQTIEQLPVRLVSRELLTHGQADLSEWTPLLRELLSCDQDGFFDLPAAQQMATLQLGAPVLAKARRIHSDHVESAVRKTMAVARAATPADL